MIKRITGIIILFIFISDGLLFAQGSQNRQQYVSLDDCLIPFWKSDTIYYETIMPIKDDGKIAQGNLLFKAEKILSVKDIYLQKKYKKGRDWKYRNGKIILTTKSRIPFFNTQDLVFEGKKEGISLKAKKEGHFVLFSEKGLLQSRQLAVTYIKEKVDSWKGYVPAYAGKYLPRTSIKLQSGQPLKVVFYGNSIETGANSSSTLNEAPYLPTWPEMVIRNIKKHYGNNITYKNVSRGGMSAKWGFENAATLVNPEKPDLVVIGFGMNDGSARIPPGNFMEQIRGIMEVVKMANPSSEFIVIATMLANPDAVHSGIQKEYRKPVLDLTAEGVAVADMTSIHEELLRHKAYQDMTGNNINHPNDYLARWYAQVISALLIP